MRGGRGGDPTVRCKVPAVLRNSVRQGSPGHGVPTLAEPAELPQTPAAVSAGGRRSQTGAGEPAGKLGRIRAAARAPDDFSRHHASVAAAVGEAMFSIRHRPLGPTGSGRPVTPGPRELLVAFGVTAANEATGAARIVDDDVASERRGANLH